MYGQFAPMSSSTVQFAKAYRAGQIREAQQFRLAAPRGTARHRGRRVRLAYDTVMILVRRTEPLVAPKRSPRHTSSAQ